MRRIAFAAILVAAMAAPVWAEVVDGVVAAVDYRIVARSTLGAHHETFAPEQPAAIALQALIDDRLLGQEARRYGLTLSAKQLAEGLARWPMPAVMTPDEWQPLVADHMLARQFLDFRFAEFVPIPREELRAYYEAHRGDFPGSFAEVEDRVRELLAPAARARREGAYREELRARHDIRINPALLPGD